jgi:hypothetical protein
MLNKLLKSAQIEGAKVVEELFARLGDSPNIAWYPSAGLDFRDLVEVDRTQAQPEIFFHTDYDAKNVELRCGVLFEDINTRIYLHRITELAFKTPTVYVVNPDYVDFPELANPSPKVFLLDVEVNYQRGVLRKPVVYFFMENINFLDEVLLRHGIKLSHLIKVREGMAWGGNRKSITSAYAFLGNLNVKHVLIDDSADPDKNLIQKLLSKHGLKLIKFVLKNPAQRRNIDSWSNLDGVKVLNVFIHPNESLTDDDFEAAIQLCKKP